MASELHAAGVDKKYTDELVKLDTDIAVALAKAEGDEPKKNKIFEEYDRAQEKRRRAMPKKQLEIEDKYFETVR